MPQKTDVKFEKRLRDFAPQFDAHLRRFLEPGDDVDVTLAEAVRYAALAPGKRVRPYLVIRSCELTGGRRDQAWHVAAAVECVHAFSLVHDDLPAMDDDDVRRGQPTCHKKYGEAAAVLAGDALLALAFELLAAHTRDGSLVRRLVRELAVGTGWSGMIGGQMADMRGAGSADLGSMRFVHERKTARLFRAACRMGAMLGAGRPDVVDALGRYGHSLGLAFQIADDLLDASGGDAPTGDDAGNDTDIEKPTYPRVVGMDESRAAARDAVEAATSALAGFAAEADDLRALARFVIDRNY